MWTESLWKFLYSCVILYGTTEGKGRGNYLLIDWEAFLLIDFGLAQQAATAKESCLLTNVCDICTWAWYHIERFGCYLDFLARNHIFHQYRIDHS